VSKSAFFLNDNDFSKITTKREQIAIVKLKIKLKYFSQNILTERLALNDFSKMIDLIRLK
jgi:hypothetical protein